MISLLYLMSTVAHADTRSRVELRSCGAASQSISLYREEHTLEDLGLRLANGVDGTTPVYWYTNTNPDDATARYAALSVAASLGYVVRPRRGVVRPARTGTPSTEATVLVLLDPPDAQWTQGATTQHANGRAIVAWPERLSESQVLRVVVDSVGIAPGMTVDSPLLPEDALMARMREYALQGYGKESEPAQDTGPLSAGMDRSRVQLWTGDALQLCDLLAAQLEPVFLLEEGIETDILISSVAAIPVLDALDILTALAPDFGFAVVEAEELVLLQRMEPPAQAFDSPTITLIPAGETLYGLTPDALERRFASVQTDILNTRVVRTRTGGLVIMLGDQGMFSHIPVSAPAAQAATPPLEGRGVTLLGEGRYRVERDAFSSIHGIEDVLAQVRMVPHKDESGAVVGYRLSGIRSGSMTHHLGLKNGDILHRVNGLVINGIDSAMTAYEALSGVDHVTLQVSRRNTLYTFEYEVVPPHE